MSKDSKNLAYKFIKSSNILINTGPGKLEKVCAFGDRVFVAGNIFYIYTQYKGDSYKPLASEFNKSKI
jgi:hypothetical protein